jgi:hypothetical protein
MSSARLLSLIALPVIWSGAAIAAAVLARSVHRLGKAALDASD